MSTTISGTLGVSLAAPDSVQTAALQSGAVTRERMATPYTPGGVVNATGSSMSIPGIPSWATRVTVATKGVKFDGNSGLDLRLSGQGALSAAYRISFTDLNGTTVSTNQAPAAIAVCNVIPTDNEICSLTTLVKVSSDWVVSSTASESTTIGSSVVANHLAAGFVEMQEVLTTVSLRPSGPGDGFVAGSIVVSWE